VCALAFAYATSIFSCPLTPDRAIAQEAACAAEDSASGADALPRTSSDPSAMYVTHDDPPGFSWDRDDMAMFDLCFGGPGISPFCGAPAVACFCLDTYDLDGDGDVDLFDAAAYQAGLVDPRCCNEDGQCDDGVFCNGRETCVDGFCRGGVDPCPGWACSEESAECLTAVCDPSGPPFCEGQKLGVLEDDDICEASGLVASRLNPGVLWTHNDNWGDNRLFAIGRSGVLLGKYTMGTGAIDSEDISTGPGPIAGIEYLYVGDIGDNESVRDTVFIRRAPEPVVRLDQPPVTVGLPGVAVITLKYPAGADAPGHKDAETLMVDPVNGDIYIITKRVTPGLVYRAASPHSTAQTITLQLVASVPWAWATAGDISPDGSSIIVRRYTGLNPPAAIWHRAPGTPLWEAFRGNGCKVPLPPEPQGEAVSWDWNGRGILTVSEDETPGAEIPIWYTVTRRN
jgi:hypothetical protein